MALIPKVLYRGIPDDTSTTLYTVTNTADKYAIVKEIIIYNNSATDAIAVSIYSVPSGGAIDDEYRIFGNEILPQDTVVLSLSMVLEQNESLRAVAELDEDLATPVAAVSLIISGVHN